MARSRNHTTQFADSYDDMSGAAASALPNTSQLESLVTRIVDMEKEKREFANAIKDCYAEAKSKGFDVKAMRIVVKHAMEDAEQRQRREVTQDRVDDMESRLGDLFHLPLGQAAMARAEAEA